MMNPDVPYEAILKYIKRDRDNYKAKAEKLEQDVRALEEELRRITAKDEKREQGYLNQIENLRRQLAIYRDEVHAARTDIRQSKTYKNLEEALREKTVRCQLVEVRCKKFEDIARRLQAATEIVNKDPVPADPEPVKPKRKKFIIF